MKKHLLLIVILLMSVAVTHAQPETLVMWHRYDLADTNNPNSVNLNALITDFEAQTGVEVIYEQVAWDQLSTKLTIAGTSGGDVPDVIAMGSQYMPSLLDAGVLRPMDDLLADAAWTPDLNDADSAACLIDGERYCLMVHTRGGITYYRADAFDGGFPQTTDAWLQVAPSLSGEDSYFSTQYAGRSFASIETLWYPLIVSNGGAIFDDEGRPAWATDEVAGVVEFMRTQFDNGYFPELNITGDFPDAEAPWLNGEAASFRGASWSAMFVPGLYDAVDSGDVLLTGGVDFGNAPRVFIVSDGWVVPEGAANPQAAGMWLELFMQPEFLATWARSQFGIPTLPQAAASDVFDTPFFESVEVILSEQGVYMQRSPYYQESLDVLVVAFQELLLDPDMDPLTRLEAAQDEVLSRYW
ncbi:MAG: extracellular solute-binding protein [Chloroflexota bacterium]